VNAYAGVALPNPASEALHAAIGMRRIGVYRAVGYKHGRWVDVAWYGLRLRDPDDPPAEPVAIADLVAAEGELAGGAEAG
jgi:phosphinothricin acetyltransferase